MEVFLLKQLLASLIEPTLASQLALSCNFASEIVTSSFTCASSALRCLYRFCKSSNIVLIILSTVKSGFNQ